MRKHRKQHGSGRKLSRSTLSYAVAAALSVSAVTAAAAEPAMDWGQKATSAAGKHAAQTLPERIGVAETPPQYEETGVIGDPDSWRTDEFDAAWGMSAIGAHHAYARGLTGAGISIGQFDTGVDLDHPEFAAGNHVSLHLSDPGCSRDDRGTRIVFDAGAGGCMSTHGDEYTIDANWVFPDDGDPYAYAQYGSHGTHVAGTTVAARDGEGMHGVAFNSRLISARFFADTAYAWSQDDDGTWERFAFASTPGGGNVEGVRQIYEQLQQHGARALNIEVQYATSPETTVEDLRQHYQDDQQYWDAIADGAIESGIINVVAAGNYGSIPNLYPGLPEFRPDAERYYLAVGSLSLDEDGSYDISGYSNRCAYAMNWCVMAPGDGILSSVIDEGVAYGGTMGGSGTEDDPYWFEFNEDIDVSPVHGYADFSGTSMAAPHAIGALALLFERFPYLTGPQVRDVLLTTATDMGEPGVDEIYGWGMIDLEKAVDGPGMLLVDTEVAMDQRAGGVQVWEGAAWDDWANDISGPGHLTKTGAGWLRLSGSNTFAGATVNQGVLEFTGANALDGDISAIGGGQLYVRQEATLDGDSITIDQGLLSLAGTSETGDVAVSDGGTLLVSSTGSLAAGTLGVAGAGLQADGNVQIAGDALLDDSTLRVSESGSIAAGLVSLTGGLADIQGNLEARQFDAAGTPLQVGGSLGVAGEAVIDGGSLTVNGGGLFQAGETMASGTNVLIQPAGSFSVDSLDFADGAIEIAGEASLLDAVFRDSRLDLLAGGTFQVDDLQLIGTDAIVNGTLSGGHTLVDAASSLRGAGTLGDTTVEGLISPGNSIGTLHIEGDFVQAAGSAFEAELLPPDNADLINISGTATIEGGTIRAIAHPGHYLLGQTYTIIAAQGGLSGEFDAFDVETVSPFLQLDLLYQSNGLLIDVLRGNSLASVAETYNQLSAATALDELPIDQGLLVPLTQLSPELAMEAVEQLSGEAHTGVQSALVDSSRLVRDAALARAMNGHDSFSAQRDAQADTGAWVEVHRQGGRIKGDGNAAQLRHNSHAALVGIDHQFDAGWRVGALGGIGRTDFDIRHRGAEGDVDSRHFGVYGAQSWGGFGLRAGYTYAWHDVETERRIRFPGFSDDVNGRYDATSWQAVIEGGYRFGNEAWEVEPYLQYAHVSVDTDGFTEDGGPAALRGSGADARVDLSTVGVRFDVNLGSPLQEQTWLSLRGNVGYRHAGGDQVRNSRMSWDGSEWFNVRSPAVTDEGMLLELGIAARTSANSLFEVGYTGVLSDDARDHGANARFSWQF